MREGEEKMEPMEPMEPTHTPEFEIVYGRAIDHKNEALYICTQRRLAAIVVTGRHRSSSHGDLPAREYHVGDANLGAQREGSCIARPSWS